MMSQSEILLKVESLTRELVLTNDQLEKVSNLLLKEFKNGLGKDSNENATVKMFPTFVTSVPDGTENGKFLALDLGGTNFRVLLIELNGDEFRMENEIYAVPLTVMQGTGEHLFDHIADCLAHFVEKMNLKDVKLPLGFTFSFPCRQEGLTKARLVTWTKGFNCQGVTGEDVVQMLRDAVRRRGDMDIDVVAVVNDTTGTLMSCAHKNRQCRVGVIVGTGTNACYMEKIENVELWQEHLQSDGTNLPKQVIVNTEWGAFGDNHCLEFLRTQYDHDIDNESLNPGKQIFEKMISGMYMGELVRKVLLRLSYQEKLIFGGKTTEKLRTPYAFQTQFISEVESEGKNGLSKTRDVLVSELGLENPTDVDCACVQLVCARASTRAAFLVSAAIATVLNKIKRPKTTVGVDGSVYRYHPHFHQLMERKIGELTQPDYKFDLMLSEDGSGRGAALVAAVACRQ